MIRFAAPLIATGLLVAGCSPVDTAQSEAKGEATKIVTEAQFREVVVGRSLDFKGNVFTINADGTMDGPWGGKGLKGTWVWDNGAMCRKITIGGEARDPDCQIWEVSGTTATATRNRGEGTSFDYKID